MNIFLFLFLVIILDQMEKQKKERNLMPDNQLMFEKNFLCKKKQHEYHNVILTGQQTTININKDFCFLFHQTRDYQGEKI